MPFSVEDLQAGSLPLLDRKVDRCGDFSLLGVHSHEEVGSFVDERISFC